MIAVKSIQPLQQWRRMNIPLLLLTWNDISSIRMSVHIPILRTGSCYFTTETKITTMFMAYSTAKWKITALHFFSKMRALRTQVFVHGRTAQHREWCIDFGTRDDLVQNMTSLRAISNDANLVTLPWRLAEDRNLHHSEMTAQFQIQSTVRIKIPIFCNMTSWKFLGLP
jgi:hypothetical protein